MTKRPHEDRTPLRSMIMRQRFKGYVIDAMDEFIKRVENKSGVHVWNQGEIFDRLFDFGEFLSQYTGLPLEYSREFNTEQAEADNEAIIFAAEALEAQHRSNDDEGDDSPLPIRH